MTKHKRCKLPDGTVKYSSLLYFLNEVLNIGYACEYGDCTARCIRHRTIKRHIQACHNGNNRTPLPTGGVAPPPYVPPIMPGSFYGGYGGPGGGPGGYGGPGGGPGGYGGPGG